MAEHEIYMTVPRHEVLNADVEFEVRSDGDLLGFLKVSRGNLEWRPRHRRNAIPVEWEAFAAWMDGE